MIYSVNCCKKNIKPVERAMLNLLGNIKSFTRRGRAAVEFLYMYKYNKKCS